jgi:L,D-transpeptidase catalytic domain/Putative peptidoglycan binding domain
VIGARTIGLGLLAALAVLGFSAAFAITAAAEPEAVGALAAGHQTTTTTTDPEDPPPTEPTEPEPVPRAGIPVGVSIGHVDVGGLNPYDASVVVRESFARPLVLVSGNRRFSVTADDIGARANVKKAIGRARFSRPGTNVPLHVWVPRERVRGYVESLAGELDKAAVSSRIVLRGATIRATRSVDGRRLERVTSARAIRVALKTNSRARIPLEFVAVKPKAGEASLGAAIVIMRSSNRLRYYLGAKLRRTFGVATGEARYPTPLGSYEIVTMQRDPWWYPPPSDWAADSEPVPPGPGNPLGTRWMGISAPYVGIHGTPDSASIGYSASHGCIRMRISEAEWLFQHVKVGTPVFIVAR